ncbi:MAG: sugar phosphate isomerase/epimerase [Rhodobacteraceae bacterium]|nr:sugar phosphate isomerase/epimerase [Paracoccaceae bacterium]
MPTISYQLYCSRNFGPIEKTLEMIAKAGFTEAEGYGGLYDDLPGLRSALKANGIAMTSGHFDIAMVEGDPGTAIAIAKTLGMSRVYIPYLQEPDRPTDEAGWRAFGARLAAAGAPIIAEGLAFGWHNHDFELVDLGGGLTPLDCIAEAGVSLQLDLGWVARSGADPLKWITKYGAQISAAHVKDIAPAGEALDEDGWADIGHGTLDWAAITAALKAANVTHYVVERDNPSDDTRFATRSHIALSSYS